MSIDLKTVKHISKLSRISLDEEKAKKLETDSVSYTHLTLPTNREV